MSGRERMPDERIAAPDLLERARAALAAEYEVVREVGRGGTSIVFLARDLRQPRDVAIKVLRPEFAAIVGPDRFRREIDIAAALNHPHVLPLHDSGEADGLLYYVTPYIEGESLSGRLKREGRLPLEDALGIATEVAQGLDYAHRRGIVHRDVKPANILLSDGHAVIADFGIARVRDALALHTADGYALGTPAYMSPEQATGGDVDGRTDVYALGCVLYEMLTGSPPFTAMNAHAVIVERFGHRTPTLTPVRRDVPSAVVGALKSALAFEREERPETAAAFASAIAPSVHPTLRQIVAERWQRAPLGRRLLLATGGVVSLVVILLTSLLSPAADPRPSYLVVAHTTLASSVEDETLSIEASERLRRSLGVWRHVRTVPSVALAGLMFDAGVASGSGRTLDDLFRLASAARVRTLVTLTADVSGDRLYVEANVLDVRSRSPAREPIRQEGARDELHDLVQAIAAEILEFGGTPEDLAQLARESSDFEAIQDLREGIAAFEQWELARAEERFRSAIARDTTLARGHYYLALTLYWTASGQLHRIPELGPEIRRHALIARRHVGVVPYRDSMRIAAFASFADGDYASARREFRELIDSDSTDTYAWLGLGMIEFRDPWAIRTADGTLTPRASYNVAARAFRETVRLTPEFSVGYGHLFEIERALAGSLGTCVRRGFLLPGSRTELFWENTPQDSMAFFCPVHLDSIHWVGGERMADLDANAVADGRSRFGERVTAELNRWESFALGSPRPREFRSNRLVWQRSELGARQTDAADSLADAALRGFHESLSLSADTTAEQWIRLGSLLLATSDRRSALVATERGMAMSRRAERATLPREAFNIFAATGKLERGLEVVSLMVSPGDKFLGPAHPRLAWPEEELYRVQLLGALGVDDDRLAEAFADIDRVWTRNGYSETARRDLRRQITPRVMHALVLDHSVRNVWFDGMDTPSVWAQLVDDGRFGPERARALLASNELRNSAVARYIAGARLRRSGFAVEAVPYLTDFVDWPYWIDDFDVRWGLRPLAWLERARAREAAHDVDGARADYLAFLDAWEGSDEGFGNVLSEARQALDRIRFVTARSNGGPVALSNSRR